MGGLEFYTNIFEKRMLSLAEAFARLLGGEIIKKTSPLREHLDLLSFVQLQRAQPSVVRDMAANNWRIVSGMRLEAKRIKNTNFC